MKKEKRNKGPKGSAEKSVARTLIPSQVKVVASLVCFVLLLGLLLHFFSVRKQAVELEELLSGWRHQYHLSDEQVRRIQAIELDFHGSGSPFTRPARSRMETREHHRLMAGVMNPEDGERFFRAQEGISLTR